MKMSSVSRSSRNTRLNDGVLLMTQNDSTTYTAQLATLHLFQQKLLLET